MKIVCIGFPKTGTTSLEQALEVLGFNVCRGHFRNNHSNYLMGLFANGDYDRILKIVDCFDAFADAPWGGSTLYKRIDHRFPDAKFILTTRDSAAWLKSLKNMFFDVDPDVETTLSSFYKSGAYGFCDYFRRTFDVDSLKDADDRLTSVYEDFNREALSYFSGRDDFLHVQLEDVSWQVLCDFLDRPVPARDFPRQNVRLGSDTQQTLRLTLTEAYRELISRLAIQDMKSAQLLLSALLKKDAPHFGELLRSGLHCEQESGQRESRANGG